MSPGRRRTPSGSRDSPGRANSGLIAMFSLGISRSSDRVRAWSGRARRRGSVDSVGRDRPTHQAERRGWRNCRSPSWPPRGCRFIRRADGKRSAAARGEARRARGGPGRTDVDRRAPRPRARARALRTQSALWSSPARTTTSSGSEPRPTTSSGVRWRRPDRRPTWVSSRNRSPRSQPSRHRYSKAGARSSRRNIRGAADSARPWSRPLRPADASHSAPRAGSRSSSPELVAQPCRGFAERSRCDTRRNPQLIEPATFLGPQLQRL
jgi:hypothetical protein